jgi:hypothetical protein
MAQRGMRWDLHAALQAFAKRRRRTIVQLEVAANSANRASLWPDLRESLGLGKLPEGAPPRSRSAKVEVDHGRPVSDGPPLK